MDVDDLRDRVLQLQGAMAAARRRWEPDHHTIFLSTEEFRGVATSIVDHHEAQRFVMDHTFMGVHIVHGVNDPSVRSSGAPGSS